MKVYTLRRTQFLKTSLSEAWAFFSSPANLGNITPAYMKFRITHMSGNGKMFPGQIIRYKLFILPYLPVTWTTEITHASEPTYFVDEQRSGPYSFWHHQHHFREVEGGIEMMDEVNYAIPFGFLGQLANRLFVQRRLNVIFDFRYQTLENHFNQKAAIRKSA